jgi:hypothetical protein
MASTDAAPVRSYGPWYRGDDIIVYISNSTASAIQGAGLNLKHMKRSWSGMSIGRAFRAALN